MKKILSSLFLLFFTFACSKTENLTPTSEWITNSNSGVINPSSWETQSSIPNVSDTGTTVDISNPSDWGTGQSLPIADTQKKTLSSKEYRDQLRAKIKSKIVQQNQTVSNTSGNSNSSSPTTNAVPADTVPVTPPTIITPPPPVVETPPPAIVVPLTPPSTNTSAS